MDGHGRSEVVRDTPISSLPLPEKYLMGREIERKFLLEALPDGAEDAEVRHLEQGYLALEPDGQEVRLRRSDEAYLLTVKTGGELTRGEYETKLDKGQFEALWPATEGRRLRKDRYLLEYQGRTVEIDVYHQPLRGLIVAEIEFPSKEAAGAFDPPGWMGREVTDVNFLKNRNLLEFDSVEELREEL